MGEVSIWVIYIGGDHKYPLRQHFENVEEMVGWISQDEIVNNFPTGISGYTDLMTTISFLQDKKLDRHINTINISKEADGFFIILGSDSFPNRDSVNLNFHYTPSKHISLVHRSNKQFYKNFNNFLEALWKIYYGGWRVATVS